jgi:peptide chain release factor 2
LKIGSKSYGDIFDIDAKEQRLMELEAIISRPEFWEDSDAAQRILKEQAPLKQVIEEWENCKTSLDDAKGLYDMAMEEGNEEVALDVEGELIKLSEKVEGIELRRMLSGPNDRNDAIVAIHPGAGGTESQDWAEMLLRMYLRWAEKKGFSSEITDWQPGEEAGVKSVTFTVSGEYAFGYLKAEIGIHRLVRISPFDAAKRRHTSFASVFVYPEIADDIVIEINESDLRIDTYRAQGAGGQKVNKTDSAVRITHIPTGIVVQCQNERSQHKNKATAMKILRARLYELEMEKKAEEMDVLHKAKKEIAWGSQIRSYVLQPYRLAKDHRTNYEVGNVDAVLDGDLDKFIEAYLLMAGGKGS